MDNSVASELNGKNIHVTF